MRNILRIFGNPKIELDNTSKQIVLDEIKEGDHQRLKFFSFIATLLCMVFFIMDVFYFNPQYQYLYIIADGLLLIVSASVLFTSVKGKNKSNWIKTLNRGLLFLYPLFIIVWGTVISVIDQESPLNILAFYTGLFLVIFLVYCSVKQVFIYLVAVLISYTACTIAFELPFFDDMLVMLLAGFVATTPLSIHFQKTKFNAAAAQFILRKTNLNLESEVEFRTRELKKLNQDLELEIAQRKMVEIKLREALKLAEENDRLKSEFLANISHEIRTPLNAIVGFSQMMVEDDVPHNKKVVFQELLSVNTFYLLSVIEDIFDASMIRSDQMKTVNRPFKINTFLQSIQNETLNFATKYEKEHLQVSVLKADKDDQTINTDEFLLRKAFLRLLDNAFKFTHNGKIEFGVLIKNDSFELFVSDTGIGIADKEKSKIFEPFVQGDGSFTRGYGGSGLGLAIVKGIAHSLNCTISLTSQPKHGSFFSLIFNK